LVERKDTTPMNALTLDNAEPGPTPFWVVCMCADWCRACNDYRSAFSKVAEEMARNHPQIRFVWIDVEDRADLVGDLDIETFPTLLVGNEQGLSFLGAVTPQPEVLSRLLGSLLDRGSPTTDHLPATQQVISQLGQSPELWLQTEALHR
jgi:thioredoxin 1